MTDANVSPQATSAADPVSAPGFSAPSAAQLSHVKIDGYDQEVSIEDLKRSYQKDKASDKRFQEAADLRKGVDEFLGRASKGDLSWLKGLVPGEVLTKWAEQELLQKIEWEEMSDSDRRAITAERRAQEAEDRINNLTQTQERQQASVLEERAYQEIERDIVEAVKELGHDFKATPRLIRRISEQLLADYEVSARDPQHLPMPAKTARDRAWKGLEVDAIEYFSRLSPADALQKLPPKLRDALRRADVATASGQFPTQPQRGNEGNATQGKGKKKMSTDDYFKTIEKKFKL